MGWFSKKPKINKAILSGEYFASHPEIKGHYKSLELFMTDGGVEVAVGKKKSRKVLHTFAWQDVVGFETEHKTETRNAGQRITATRMVTLGVFSLAAPKATGKVSTKFVSILRTKSGNIVLEDELSGDASSNLNNMTLDLMERNRQNVRAFVAERAGR